MVDMSPRGSPRLDMFFLFYPQGSPEEEGIGVVVKQNAINLIAYSIRAVPSNNVLA